MAAASGMSQKSRVLAVFLTGLSQVLFGTLLLGLGIVSVVAASYVAGYYQGVWAGAWVALSGLVGFVGAQSRSTAMLHVYLIQSCLSAALVLTSAVAVSVVGYNFDSLWITRQSVKSWSYSQKLACSFYLQNNNGTVDPEKIGCSNDAAAAANLGVAVLGSLMVVLAVVSAVFAGMAVCRCCGAKPMSPAKSHQLPIQERLANLDNLDQTDPAAHQNIFGFARRGGKPQKSLLG